MDVLETGGVHHIVDEGADESDAGDAVVAPTDDMALAVADDSAVVSPLMELPSWLTADS